MWLGYWNLNSIWLLCFQELWILFFSPKPLKSGKYPSWLPKWLSSNESARQCRTHRFDPWVGKIPGEGNGYPLQYSCLGNPMDRGAWRATVHGVRKSWTRLGDETRRTAPFLACRQHGLVCQYVVPTKRRETLSHSPPFTEGRLRSQKNEGVPQPDSETGFLCPACHCPLLLAVIIAFSGRRHGIFVEMPPHNHWEYKWDKTVFYLTLY